MQFQGMFPHAAGKIASNGPYRTVSVKDRERTLQRDLTWHTSQIGERHLQDPGPH